MEYRFSDNFLSLKPSAIREILKYASMPGVISLSAGNPSQDAFPKAELASIANDILSNNPFEALQYGVSEGYGPLRQYLKGYLSKKYSVGTDADEIIITNGAQQVMELAAKTLCNKGDTVVCEDPSFVGSLNAFRSLGLELAGVPVKEDGMDIDALEKILAAKETVRLIYTIPNFQNPTGVTMSGANRRRMYDLAKKYGVLIVEDNPYGDLRYSGDDIAPIKSMDDEGLVIYAGSFSKVISPGLRVGYFVAPKAVAAKMVVAKQVEDVHTAQLPQMMCYQFMKNYDYQAHLERLRTLYRAKANLCRELVQTYLAPHRVTFFDTEGGLFLWCILPDGVDMLTFCSRAVKEKGVAVVPGTAFLADEDGTSRAFRVNFSTPSDDDLREGIKHLGALLEVMQKKP